jgi:hypothetical protein
MIEEIGSDQKTATLIGLAQGGAHYTFFAPKGVKYASSKWPAVGLPKFGTAGR